MSDKTSQRTEEEMLDQTFVGYDDEMTVQTEDGSKNDGKAAVATAPVKKTNQNLLIYGVMGVAAVVVIVWKFVLGGHPQPQPQDQAPAQVVQQQQQAVQNPATTVAAVTVPDPVAVPAQPQVVAASAPTDKSPVDPASQYMGDNNTMPKLPDAATTPVKPEVKTINVEKVPAVTASNAEASSSNEKLLAQFQDMLDKKYDPKFDKIEKAIDAQKDVNKSIEERLARLEAGKTTKQVAVKPVVKADETTTDSNDVKAVKKIIVRKPIMIKHTTVTSKAKSDDGDVVIDRTSVKSKPEIQKIEPVYPSIEIHSIYSGRVWTKNSDGTLSTYSIGDKLSTGEVIKKIDEEKETITTDKRVISQ